MNVMNESDKPRGADESRRRIIKASAAAPLVATLTPNSALAMSSAVQCAKTTASYPDTTADGATDGAVRKRATKAILNSKAPSDQDLPPVLYKVVGEGGRYLPDGTRFRRRWRDIKEFYDVEEVAVLQLFDVDRHGIAGEGTWPIAQRTDGTPLSVSCWASIDPDAARHYLG